MNNKKVYAKTIKGAGLKNLDLPTVRRKGDWEKAKESRKHTPGAPNKPQRRVEGRGIIKLSDEEIEEMGRRRAGGATFAIIGKEFGVSGDLVEQALNKTFINKGKGKEVLANVLLEGAIATGVQAHQKIGELNGMQSVIATGVLTQRFIDLDKHMQATPKDISDLEEIAGLADEVRDLVKTVGLDNIHSPSVLDVDAEVTRDE